jgi:hypothetical protein
MAALARATIKGDVTAIASRREAGPQGLKVLTG